MTRGGTYRSTDRRGRITASDQLKEISFTRLRGRCDVMANRSDREPGQPAECPRRHSLKSRMGPCSRTPSGPAVHDRPHQQAGHKTAPDQRQSVNSPLQRGSHPHRTSKLARCLQNLARNERGEIIGSYELPPSARALRCPFVDNRCSSSDSCAKISGAFRSRAPELWFKNSLCFALQWRGEVGVSAEELEPKTFRNCAIQQPRYRGESSA